MSDRGAVGQGWVCCGSRGAGNRGKNLCRPGTTGNINNTAWDLVWPYVGDCRRGYWVWGGIRWWDPGDAETGEWEGGESVLDGCWKFVWEGDDEWEGFQRHLVEHSSYFVASMWVRLARKKCRTEEDLYSVFR